MIVNTKSRLICGHIQVEVVLIIKKFMRYLKCFPCNICDEAYVATARMQLQIRFRPMPWEEVGCLVWKALCLNIHAWRAGLVKAINNSSLTDSINTP